MSEPQAVIDEAQAAADAVLERGELWLMLHPIRHYRMRKRLMRARRSLLALRREWRLR